MHEEFVLTDTFIFCDSFLQMNDFYKKIFAFIVSPSKYFL